LFKEGSVKEEIGKEEDFAWVKKNLLKELAKFENRELKRPKKNVLIKRKKTITPKKFYVALLGKNFKICKNGTGRKWFN